MNTTSAKIEKLLVANRGEIAIRVLRAAAELDIRTVAIFTYEDRYSLHRYKADEAYQLGRDHEALKPYLDIDAIVQLAKRKNVDAIHPGYGLLSENVLLAERCAEAGITFVGPRPEVMRRLGDKIGAKKVAREVGVPVIEDSQIPLIDAEVAVREALRITFPVIIKASAGGGGRGMRVVRNEEELRRGFEEARAEAQKAFGDGTLFLEKYVEDPKHIEVQILGDNHGSTVHLFERDCSVQRRFQKVVEVAPSPRLPRHVRDAIFEHALKIVRHVRYNNAGTVEFLVDPQENIYFIEVNTRVQVEHTITEEVTGIDIVRTQILLARNLPLSHPDIGLGTQSEIGCNGFAIQCRITTEDPANAFKPDVGKIIAYRSPGGFGIRLDGGSAYTGAVISPFFDSLLVKVTAKGRTLKSAAERLKRALREFRIRGVATNISFLENVITHPDFLSGATTVRFIDTHPELFRFQRRFDRATKILRYLAEVKVNRNPDVGGAEARYFGTPAVPACDTRIPPPPGTKQKLTQLGREGFVDWLRNEPRIQFTDTTFRDAHQSLLATRVRTVDMLRVADGFARNHSEVFSMEVWGGATFDVALRFLHECPWQRLKLLRDAVPNILLQMLFRGSNAVGYSAYPDNLIEKFIEKSWETGVDVFRIFDAMNWFDAMKVSIRAVRERTEGLAEACICYTGDMLDPNRPKYSLQYYLDLARRLEDEGAHLLAIKDMAGLLKPQAAAELIPALKRHVSMPIHLHTHDTAGVQSATYLKAIEAGVDVVDVALASMSGLTSQPNFNSLIAILKGHPRELPMDLDSLNRYSEYWEIVRGYYYPFEPDLKGGTAEVYANEIPGGQYSNLRPQVRALGLEAKFDQVKRNYVAVNQLFGDIVKVTPTSKVVGDLAQYLAANDIAPEDVIARGHEIAFPDSVKSYFRGELGQQPGGFPEELQRVVLKGEPPLTGRPNESLPPVDFAAEFAKFQEEFDSDCTLLDFLSYKMYPKVFREYHDHLRTFGSVMNLPTPAFFYPLAANQEILVEIAPGKTLIVEMVWVSQPNDRGMRTVFLKLNGQSRSVEVLDRAAKVSAHANKKARQPGEVGAPLRGKLSRLLQKEGAKVTPNTPLFVIEAMKMESTVSAQHAGTITKIELNEGAVVEQDDLVLVLEKAS